LYLAKRDLKKRKTIKHEMTESNTNPARASG
jgi:hypothetical protein